MLAITSRIFQICGVCDLLSSSWNLLPMVEHITKISVSSATIILSATKWNALITIKVSGFLHWYKPFDRPLLRSSSTWRWSASCCFHLKEISAGCWVLECFMSADYQYISCQFLFGVHNILLIVFHNDQTHNYLTLYKHN